MSMTMSMAMSPSSAGSSSSTGDSSMQTGMPAVFFTSQHTPLYSEAWTPSTSGALAGTYIFLILLAVSLRGLFAFKAVLETKWTAKARNRRFVLVKGKPSEAGKIDKDPDSLKASLITVNGVEENVKVVRNDGRLVAPFRLSVDVPRAALTMAIAGMAYLLMLAVMTMDVGYFLCVLAGTFVGELAFGRYAQWEEH